MTESPAQHLFNLMERGEVGPDALALLKQLSAAGLASLQDTVSISGRPVPLSRALLTLVEPGKHTPEFYTAATARHLLDLDPEFFCQGKDGPGTLLWLEYNLWGWARHEDRARFGFGDYHIKSIDAWACVVFDSLPDEHKQNPVLWKCALRLGLSSAAALLAPYRPGGWMELDDKAKPIIAIADGGWAWEAALASGVDPNAPMGSGQPFWRAVLPQCPTSPAEPGSFRAAVEQWGRLQLDNPDCPPLLLAYVRRQALARMGIVSGKHTWRTLSHAKQLDYVKTLPAQWPTWNHDGLPVWLRLAVHKDVKLKDYLATLDQHPAWIAQIHTDPLGALALDMLRTLPDLPNTPPAGIDLALALQDARRVQVMEQVAILGKIDKQVLAAALDAWSLAANTPAVASTRPRARI